MMNRIVVALVLCLPLVAAFSRSPLRPASTKLSMMLPLDQPTLEVCNSLMVAEVDGENIFATLGSAAFIGVIFLSSIFDFLKQFDKPRKDNGF